jgi:PKHD-type hydroxylase
MSYNYKTISNAPEERSKIVYPYCFWEEAFTPDEIDTICELSTACGLESAKFSGFATSDNDNKPGPVLDPTVRTSKVSFHHPSEQTAWIFTRLNSIIEMVNNRWYNFDLNGYDRFQYAEYHGTDSGHYNWHIDMFTGTLPEHGNETRKLSLTLLLNDPETDFKGGEFHLGHGEKFESVKLKKGTIILFPSFSLHRVTPVTEGIRKSLVVWVLGPKWK